METQTQQTTVLNEAVAYIRNVIQLRLAAYFQVEREEEETIEFPVRHWNGDPNPLVRFCATHQLDEEAFIVLLLALLPHIQPYLLDDLIQQFFKQGGSFPEIGGIRGTNQRSFLPTGETALFLVSDGSIEKRLAIFELFSTEHFFFKKQVLWLEEVPPGEPKLSGKLVLSEEFVELFTLGRVSPPKYSASFPAKLTTTQLQAEDLIVAPETKSKLKETERWLKHRHWLADHSDLGKRLKPGFRALFFGPPGTGKTLAATILGNQFKKPVYRVDLSQVISKYIGETEKNLSRLFDKAENKDWILFFDEADALFGKRVGVKEAKDKYANQETAYLLQRIEDYPGLVILATNLKDNIDKAFLRRFHSIVHFPFPTAKERLLLWQTTLPKPDNPAIKLDPIIDLVALAQRYKLTGANINNIVQYACYLAKEHKNAVIDPETLTEGIRREFEKEEK